MNMDYFNAEKTRDNLVAWIKDWFEKNGPTSKAIVGISGGKDSTVVAALCARALGKDRVLGVLMPNGVQPDIDDSHAICDALGIERIVVDIGRTYKTLAEYVEDAIMLKFKDKGVNGLSEQTKINLAPRLRMTTLYAVSQTVGGRVVNTSNFSEYVTGYFTKNGDNCGDLKPLLHLTKNEVVAIGLTMPEIPRHLVEKTPADGLSNKTDEDKIGFTYDALDTVIRGRLMGSPDPALELPMETLNKIANRRSAVEFKTRPEEVFTDLVFNTQNK